MQLMQCLRLIKQSQENFDENLTHEKSNLVTTEEISSEQPASAEEPRDEQAKEQLYKIHTHQ